MLLPNRLVRLACLTAPLLFAACSAAPPADVARMAQEWSEYMQRDYVLRPGDRLRIHIEPDVDNDLDQEVIIPPQGVVYLRKLEAGIRAVDISIGAFREEVRRAYAESVIKTPPPRITVTFLEVGAKSIYVTGEVFRPGPVPYSAGLTVAQAVAASGGMRITADWDDIRLLRSPGTPGQRTQRVNYEAILHRSEPDYLLLPGDVVYVQTSSIGDVGNFVELYVRRVLPIGGNNPGSFFIF